ncbi:cytochrome c [Candidatus Pelagibacter sp.]|nr:cytochrome c [Candidatus Pelagibacter sp.]MDC1082862.1 cytochrome c [Candidatus Pelagibacter sp.]|tara:strand:+ start:486 stop:911 length:426 start_codon:yes stop_codon:yes gene_type:complete
MKIIFFLIFLILLSGNSSAHNHFPITIDSKLMIARGKIAYENNCVSCHMINLAGAENWRGLDEDGHRKAPPLNGTGHTWHHDDKTLHSIIKYGLANLIDGYEGKMMGFEENLSDKDIDSVLAYIKSYWSKDKYEHQINLSK